MILAQNPILYLFRTLWRFAEGRRGFVILAIVLFVCGNLTMLSEPLVIGHLLNIVQTQGVTSSSIHAITFTLLAFFAIDLVFWMFHGPARIIEQKTAMIAFITYKTYMLDGIMHLPAQWHTDHHSGETIDKVEKSSRALFDFAENSFRILETIVRLIAPYIVLIFFLPSTSYTIFIIFCFVLFIVKKYDRVLIRQWSELNIGDNAISAKVYDVLSNVTTVIILRIERLVHTSIVRKMKEPFDLFMRTARLNELKWFSTSMTAMLSQGCVLGVYVYGAYHANEVVMVGTLTVLYQYVNRINDAFFNMTEVYGNLVRQKTAIHNADVIRKEFSGEKSREGEELSKRWSRIQIDGLSFSYHSEEGANVHLDDVALTIKRGEKIALVGHSGAGKTTLLKVMRGLYVPQKVSVRVNGKKLSRGFASISESIALVPQDPEIFSTTIRENITVGVDYPQKKIEHYARLAQFHDVALRLPKGYDSSVVEKGVNLSGGEKQRLALTRGLLASRDKQILLLDEPTSSVDSQNERLIYSNVFREFTELTVLSSIHRLHLLPLFDRVVFFEDGKVIASGHYAELLKTCQPFAALWNAYVDTLQHSKKA